MEKTLDVIEVEDRDGSRSWDVRVNHEVKRHGGKLVANAPTERLAKTVVDGLDYLILDQGLDWDREFEVKE